MSFSLLDLVLYLITLPFYVCLRSFEVLFRFLFALIGHCLYASMLFLLLALLFGLLAVLFGSVARPAQAQPPRLFAPGSDTYLIGLLDEQDSYTETEVKAMLRARCPEFAKLKAKAAPNKANHILMVLVRYHDRLWVKASGISNPRPVIMANEPTDYSLSTKRLVGQRPLRLLLHLDPLLTWLVDFEFMTCTRGKGPFPFTVSIIDLRGDDILTCNVNYQLSIEEMEEAVTPYLAYGEEGLQFRLSSFRRAFLKHYGGTRTNGMTQLQIHALLESLYTPQHRVLGYGTNQDITMFHRFLRCENNSPLASNTRHHQDLDIRNLLTFMLPSQTRCHSKFTASLDKIHGKLIKKSEYKEYHRAEVDVRAFWEIVKLMIEVAERE